MSERRLLNELRSLDETEASRRDFGPIGWFLLGLANVDRRDVVSHSDRVRYMGIGTLMLFFTAYAFAGWLVFLSTARIGGHDSGGMALRIIGALIGATAVLTVDRMLVGITKPNFEYRLKGLAGEVKHAAAEASGEDGQAVQAQPVDFEAIEPLPSLVAGRNLGSVFGRLLVAFIIGVVVTQAFDLKVFGGDIDRQRADEQIASLTTELHQLEASHNSEVRQHVAAVRLAARHVTQAERGELGAEHYSHGFCRAYRVVTAGVHEKSVCQTERETALRAKEEKRQLDENDPSNGQSKSGARYAKAKAVLSERIEDLRLNPSHSRSAGSGPGTDTADLFRVMGKSVESVILYAAILLLALLLDLSAILFKLTGYGGEYERRQALRRWSTHSGVMLIHTRAAATRQRELRLEQLDAEVRRAAAEQDAITEIQTNADSQREHRASLSAAHERAMTDIEIELAAQRAIRAAGGEAEVDSGVVEEARRAAARQAKEWIRSPPSGATPADEEPTTPPPGPKSERESSADLRAGTMVKGRNRYWRLIEQVSLQGGLSRVWSARPYEDDNITAAIKFMPVGGRGAHGGALFDLDSERARKDREMLQLMPNDARHLPVLLDYGDDGERGGIWHATEYAPLGTLHERYARAGERSLVEILDFARQVVKALSEVRTAVGNDIVHGDIKPENLLLFETAPAIAILEGAPRLVLADWGLARMYGDQPMAVDLHKQGTVEFSAAQVWERAGSVSVFDDLFSIGAVIWWCVTGSAPGAKGLVRPVGEPEAFAAYREQIAHARESLPPLNSIYTAIPPDVSEFVAALLSDVREQRMPIDQTLTLPTAILNEAEKRINTLMNRLIRREEQGATIILDPARERGSEFDGGSQRQGGDGGGPVRLPTPFQGDAVPRAPLRGDAPAPAPAARERGDEGEQLSDAPGQHADTLAFGGLAGYPADGEPAGDTPRDAAAGLSGWHDLPGSVLFDEGPPPDPSTFPTVPLARGGRVASRLTRLLELTRRSSGR